MTQIATSQIELDELPALERGRRSLEQIKNIDSTKANLATDNEIFTETRSTRSRIFVDAIPIEESADSEPHTRRLGLRIGSISVEVEEKVLYLLGSCMGVFTIGLNDTATGANLPSIQKHYNLSYEVVSLVFLAGFGGYLVACMLNSVLQNAIGTRWMLLTAGLLYAGGSLLIAFAPPFPLVMIGLIIMGFGGGFYEACLTSIVAHFENSRFMNILYSFFGIGALSAPFIIGGFAKAAIPWNLYYWFPFSLGVILIAAHFMLFKQYVIPAEAETEHHTLRARFTQLTQMRITWQVKLLPTTIGMVLIMLSFAITLTLSNWLTSYLIEVKGAGVDISRYQLSMLWTGITAGRMFFSLPYIRVRDRVGNALLLVLLCGAIAALWAAKANASNWAVIATAGFFLGPNTPAILSIVSIRVPPRLKGAAVSITIGSGLIGAALGPLLFGVAVGKIVPGLEVLPPVIIVLSTLSALTFWTIPPREKRD
ncbi:hypothetical protein NLJ89_g5037 [Agrocybe chaxingu]|uniref:Major facilitator superfamily (MFS) profile domain-containing protein n=1 Tax=Agrocybe chaxingu TaxID=84603 RepID=A0A9W8MX83_9AGAR|nr:hypothetical protein NLJ89_g5037 [Agrocybe chaxingu]